MVGEFLLQKKLLGGFLLLEKKLLGDFLLLEKKELRIFVLGGVILRGLVRLIGVW